MTILTMRAVLVLAIACLVCCSSKPESAGTMPALKRVAPEAMPRAGTAQSVPVSWKTVESAEYEWNGRGRVKLVAVIPEPYSDPGNFTKIRINVPGEEEFVLENPGWMNWDDKQSSLRDVPFTKANLLPSSHAFLIISNGRRDVLFLSSWSYASDAARLHVIELGRSGSPVVTFNDLFEPSELADLDEDGMKELVGMPCLSQSFGPDGLLSTYDPIHVLKFGAEAPKSLAMSILLSKTYNEKHGFGWAGPECSEKLAVYRPKHGAPRILPTEEAEKLAESESKK